MTTPMKINFVHVIKLFNKGNKIQDMFINHIKKLILRGECKMVLSASIFNIT